MTLRNLEGNTVVSRECGKIRLGYLVLVLFLAVFGYLSYRIVPVYTQKDAFHEELLGLAGTATRRGWNHNKIVTQVMQLGAVGKLADRLKLEIKDLRQRKLDLETQVDQLKTQLAHSSPLSPEAAKAS